MKSTFAVLATVAAVAVAAPEGCASSAANPFTITVVNVSGAAKRSLEQRQTSGILTLTLADGILKDQAGRTAYIASNYQFQFDAPPQENALSQSGYSICNNGSLALAETTVFWQCNSGAINNLYDRDWAPQCIPVHLNRREGSTAPPATQIPDGQPQAPTAGPAVTQIPDGQPQGPTPGAPVTQIPDGQPQAPAPGAPVTQIPDGQPQAPAPGAPVTQIPDGQPQAPAPGAPVTQIPDGQPQAPAPGAPVTQIPDGQPQAPAPGAPVTQIPDGQPQGPNATFAPSATPTQFTGAAAYATPFIGAFAAGIVAAVALL